MTSQNTEAFELSTALDFYCKVQRISEDKSLSIEVFKTNVGGKRYIIRFEDVLAVKIPIRWIGPVFDIASKAELLGIAEKVNDERLSNLSESDVYNRYTLYKLRNPSYSRDEEAMYILAGKVFVEEKIRKGKKS